MDATNTAALAALSQVADATDCLTIDRAVELLRAGKPYEAWEAASSAGRPILDELSASYNADLADAYQDALDALEACWSDEPSGGGPTYFVGSQECAPLSRAIDKARELGCAAFCATSGRKVWPVEPGDLIYVAESMAVQS